MPLGTTVGLSDDQILTELFVKHRGPVRALLLRRTDCAATADDALQDAFEAICNLQDLRGIRNLGGYLFSVALRRLSPTLDFGSLTEDAADEAVSDEGQMCPQAHVFVDEVGDCAARLSSSQQKVLGLSMEGFTHDEIAERLRTNAPAVAKRLQRARAALSKMLSLAKQGKVRP